MNIALKDVGGGTLFRRDNTGEVWWLKLAWFAQNGAPEPPHGTCYCVRMDGYGPLHALNDQMIVTI